MKLIFFFILIFPFSIFSQISLSDLDKYRAFSNPDEKSIIDTGTNFCNEYFANKKSVLVQDNKSFKNFFLCKFSKKRNRFYIYMLSQSRDENKSLKKLCMDVIRKWPWVADHMDLNLNFQAKEYLNGFYIENIFNNKILNFTNNLENDSRLIDNEINTIILEKRDSYTLDNEKNNNLIKKEIKKLNRAYKKILSSDESNLDKLIKEELNKIVRYKIFINDTSNFISYSCNWSPGKGLDPYVKREKFSEFENS